MEALALFYTPIIELTGCESLIGAIAFIVPLTWAGLLMKDIFCFKRNRITNKPNTNKGIENNGNIGGMRYEDQ